LETKRTSVCGDVIVLLARNLDGQRCTLLRRRYKADERRRGRLEHRLHNAMRQSHSPNDFRHGLLDPYARRNTVRRRRFGGVSSSTSSSTPSSGS
jgi:hypothetical protein